MVERWHLPVQPHFRDAALTSSRICRSNSMSSSSPPATGGVITTSSSRLRIAAAAPEDLAAEAAGLRPCVDCSSSGSMRSLSCGSFFSATWLLTIPVYRKKGRDPKSSSSQGGMNFPFQQAKLTMALVACSSSSASSPKDTSENFLMALTWGVDEKRNYGRHQPEARQVANKKSTYFALLSAFAPRFFCSSERFFCGCNQ